MKKNNVDLNEEKTITAKKATTAKKVATKEKTATTKVAKEKVVKAKTATTKEKKSSEPKATKAKETSKVLKVVDSTQVEINTIVEAMLDKKGKKVCTMDLSKLGTSICDHFVICNADSTTNVLAIADNVEDEMIVKCKQKVVRKQGKENAFWIILDYSNIVVHIFQTEYRDFYRLEDLWADAEKKHFELD